MPPNCERRMQGVFASMMGTETFVANFVDAQRKVLRMDFAKDQVSGRAERSGSWTRGRGRVGEDEARDSSTGGTPGGNENEGKRSSRSRPTTGRDHPARRETGTTGTGSPAPRPTWSPASGGAPASPASHVERAGSTSLDAMLTPEGYNASYYPPERALAALEAPLVAFLLAISRLLAAISPHTAACALSLGHWCPPGGAERGEAQVIEEDDAFHSSSGITFKARECPLVPRASGPFACSVWLR